MQSVRERHPAALSSWWLEPNQVFRLPAPQLNGVPFVYAQYRFTIGVELYADKPPRWLRKGN